MVGGYARLDFGPGWEATNDNLIELVDLFDGDRLDWFPRAGEWSARVIYTHLIAARYHGPIPDPDDLAHFETLFGNCATPLGIQDELRRSWAMVAEFLSNEARLDATYQDGAGEPGGAAPAAMGSMERAEAGLDLGYVDVPERNTGHYIAYHRFAHDLHHRSTLVGYLAELGVTLDGRRIRPL